MQLLAVIISYLLGSVSFSFLAGKLLKGIDIRQHGSGNAGATNTLRILGKGPAIAVLVLDVAKGVAAVILGRWLGDGNLWIPILCGLAVIIGHNWPVFFGFRGGKGIATAIGVLATLSFLPALFAGLIAILLIVITRYVSLGSLVFTALTPVFLAIMGRERELLWASLIIAVFAYVRHRSNIKKLIARQENKLGASRKQG
ncbi:glycerol-3-phosphate 1-O-acyltransferase PlsY [Paenibacillus aurantius]|uniref:Glycerol-3-phosphate acyltransferase n=1 Tax=Paenibacillus aurantius TaxID=2918900 RepID=A0AA96LC01_9BACL|nr:glycerol-3-phosphate 1-O-acyltransferase PlsY [Paenibacillus aurantius]WNQ09301.1 glycerol-3-phosphate 1-O-acyltransferase PlsY [Paenibacillus aurantius]